MQETYHDRQGEEVLTYLYESNSYVPRERIDQGTAAANDADRQDAHYWRAGLAGPLQDLGQRGAGGMDRAGTAAPHTVMERGAGSDADVWPEHRDVIC